MAEEEEGKVVTQRTQALRVEVAGSQVSIAEPCLQLEERVGMPGMDQMISPQEPRGHNTASGQAGPSTGLAEGKRVVEEVLGAVSHLAVSHTPVEKVGAEVMAGMWKPMCRSRRLGVWLTPSEPRDLPEQAEQALLGLMVEQAPQDKQAVSSCSTKERHGIF